MSLISKDDVIEQLRYEAETDENQEHKFVYERAAHIIAAMPPVDAAQVLYGAWNFNFSDMSCRCSVCNTKALHDDKGNIVSSLFCPNCGSMMRDGKKE